MEIKYLYNFEDLTATFRWPFYVNSVKIIGIILIICEKCIRWMSKILLEVTFCNLYV